MIRIDYEEQDSELVRIMIIHGPNLNHLEKRNCQIYGGQSLDEINRVMASDAASWEQSWPFSLDNSPEAVSLSLALDFRQSNHEGDIIDFLQEADQESYSAVIINPAAYTHTSLAIADTLDYIRLPVIEVHLSNILASSEKFRNRSLTARGVDSVVTGGGVSAYRSALFLAIMAALKLRSQEIN